MTKKTKEIPDDLNPKLLFHGVHTQLLVQLLADHTDLNQLIIDELKNRGLDTDGSESEWWTKTKKYFDID